MKIWKRILSLVLATAMLCGMLVFTAGAVDKPSIELLLKQENSNYYAVVHVNGMVEKFISGSATIVYDSSVVSFPTPVRNIIYPQDIISLPTISSDSPIGTYAFKNYGCRVDTENEVEPFDISNIDLLKIPFTLVDGKSVNDVTLKTIRIETDESSDIAQAIIASSVGTSVVLQGNVSNDFFIVNDQTDNTEDMEYAYTPDLSVFPHAKDVAVKSVELTPATSTVTVNGSKDEKDTTVNVRAAVIDEDDQPVSGLALTWKAEGVTGVTVENGVVTIPKNAPAGTVTVTATEPSGKSGTATITVERAAAELTTVTLNPTSVEVVGEDGSDKTVTATATDQFGGTMTGVTWSITPPTGGEVVPFELSDNKVRFDADANPTTITVQKGAMNGEYTVTATPTSGTAVSATLTVGRASAALKSLEVVLGASNITIGGQTSVTLTAKDQFDNNITPSNLQWVVTPANAGITVNSDNNTLSVASTVTPGDYTIQARSGAVTSEAVSFKVLDGAPQNITITSSKTATYGDGNVTTTFDIKSTNESGAEIDISSDHGTLTWESSNTDVAEIDSTTGEITVKNAGTTEITVTAAAVTGKYAESELTYTFTVEPKDVTLNVTVSGSYEYGDTIDPDDITVDPSDADLGIIMQYPAGKLNVGTYTVTATISNPNYKATVNPATVRVLPAEHGTVTINRGVESHQGEEAPEPKTLVIENLSNYVADVVNPVFGEPIESESEISSADIADGTLTIEYTPWAADPDTARIVTIEVTSDSHENFDLVFSLTATDKTDISDDIEFNSREITYDGDSHTLTASYNGSSEGFTYVPADPSYTAPGKYPITATYSDETHFGTKVAVLTILDKVEIKSPSDVKIAGDENQDKYSYDLTQDSEGNVSVVIRDNGLKTYDRGGESGKWVPVVFNTSLNGDPLDIGQIYTAEKKDENFTPAEIVTDEAGSNSYAVYWVDASDPMPKTFFIATAEDGANAKEVTASLYKAPTPPPVIDDTPTNTDKGSTSSGTVSRKKKDADTESKYSVTVPSGTNGTVSVSPEKPYSGDRVTITTTPNAGYEVGSVTVTTADNRTLTVRSTALNQYTFTMPSSAVTVDVQFVEIQQSTGSVGFFDVTSRDWFSSAVSYVSANGLMAGNGSYFSPNNNLTRGMMAQILYNMEGASAGAAASFPDVSSSDWFAPAVGWASAQNYMSGYGSGRFGPNDSITREQVASILYRYAQAKNIVGISSASLAQFSDGATTSDWAAEAVSWAVGAKLISGKSGNRLDPTGTATRAEIAQILMGFHQYVIAH